MYIIYIQEKPNSSLEAFDTIYEQHSREDLIDYADSVINSGIYYVMIVEHNEIENWHFPVYFKYNTQPFEEYDKPKGKKRKRKW